MKRYKTTVKCEGKFINHNTGDKWYSKLCSVTVNYNPKNDKIYIIRVYRQKSNNSNEWIHPYFKKDQFDILKIKAKWNYDHFVLNKDNIELKEKKGIKNKHHKEDLCERCIDIGGYCK
jgi:hypothetical protein